MKVFLSLLGAGKCFNHPLKCCICCIGNQKINQHAEFFLNKKTLCFYPKSLFDNNILIFQTLFRSDIKYI